MFIDYEMRNELLIYWTMVFLNKFDFANKIIIFIYNFNNYSNIFGGFFLSICLNIKVENI